MPATRLRLNAVGTAPQLHLAASAGPSSREDAEESGQVEAGMAFISQG